ncbi:MAG: GTP-binding protein [[Eubacterium] sulci]|nr:GTP-binding protein [[Eubacterium] sulci]
MTKVDIFSGFLGAGKTTLIKKLISEAYKDEKLVLIENEFGDIGVDGEFLKDSGIQVNEMNSGCICCSLVGDFGKALAEVVQKYNPDRILIEPSGVGKLSDVIMAVENLHNDELVLNGFTTVVDAKKCKMYMKNFGEFFNNQIENASAIILSHTAGLAQDKLDACVALLREHNETAEIVTTDWNELDGKLILETMEKRAGIDAELEHLKTEMHEHHHHHEHEEHEHHHHHEHEEHEHHHHHEHEEHEHDHDHEHGEGCCCGHDHGHEEHEHHHHDHEHGEGCGCGHHHEHGHHHADEVFQSIGMETSHKFSEAEINDFLGKLGNFTEFGTILRAKGVVENAEGGWIHFDYVPGEPDVRTGSAATTGMICVIGVDIEEANIREALAL